MLLTPYGLREWLIISVVAGAAVAVAAWLGWWWLLGLVVAVWLALLSFFRDPWRRVPADLPPGTMLSPADGTVSAVFTVDEHEATGGPAQVIRIFLSVLNVHVNRAPYDVEVVALEHTPGQYLNAQTEESSRVNENMLITLRLPSGELMGVRQIAGMVARRIVCPLTPGDRLERGQKFGMIKFGSTAEVILPRPADVTVNVTKGQKVRGGLTLLATLAMPASNSSSAGTGTRVGTEVPA
ncbi:MAG: phosphatidylserine decarboxylase family protein [Phycisphaerales bacterium]|nr:phosphatidylserine decarboxylase family protein [Phycisphaerae bacterium]NNF42860.1 phosphatidylserine decarboxylase family protein [Phycisphaerales bacterium]NNM27085.1 phosphatidylserine decarboxylase family protein [Phycisphaerales bacterium]